jgi:hypothetical protein
MPINYATTEITAIANGNAITANILNGPSVSLATRTVEIQRNSNYDNFIRDYSTNALVKLTPTLEPTEPKVTLITRVKGDTGEDTGTYRRYFSAALDGAALSVYADAEHGGRYVVSGSMLSGFFGDSANLNVLSNRLVTPGDGVYLKVPLKNTGEPETATNFPDLVAPKNTSESIGNSYALTVHAAADSRSITQHDLVKLPMLNEITLLTAGRDSLLTSLNTELNTLVTATADASTGELTLEDANGGTLTLRLTGVHNTICQVTHMVDSGSDCILTVVPASGPIFRHTDTSSPVGTVGLTFGIYAGGVIDGQGPTAVPLAAVTGYLINPKQLEEGYAYIPLLRLTETTLEVGDKSYNLVANYDYSNGNIPLNSLNGAPSGAAPVATDAGTHQQVIKLLDIPRTEFRSGVHTIRLPSPVLDTSGADFIKTTASSTTDMRLRSILDKVKLGSRLTLVSARYVPLADITSTLNNANINLYISCSVTAGNALTVLNFVAGQKITTTSASLVNYGSTLEIYPEDTAVVTVLKPNATDISITAFIKENAGEMLTGSYSLELDLLVTD